LKKLTRSSRKKKTIFFLTEKNSSKHKNPKELFRGEKGEEKDAAVHLGRGRALRFQREKIRYVLRSGRKRLMLKREIAP